MESLEARGSAGAAAGLLERERELELLTGALERAAEGDARVIVIEGDAGLGKSSLLECTRQLAQEYAFEVLRARGGSLERTLGWGVARQLFEARVLRAAAAERRSLLRGSASLAAPLLGLAGANEDEPSPVKDFHFEHGLYWLVGNLVERAPLALLIDDLQWCDDATLEWLLYLVRRSERLPLLVVVATRPGEPGAPTALLELVAAEPVARTVALSALGEGATETLLERAYGATVDHEFAVACHLRTGGNPLFVTELAVELTAEGVDPVASSTSRLRTLTPEGVSRVTVLRLARLSESALELARAVAVLQPAAELRYASELAGLAEEAAAIALDELVEARVLSALYPLTFVHPLIGSVVYDDLPAARRAMMHKRAARLLVREGDQAGRVAAHLLRTAPAGDRWVVDELRSAAERELARGSPSTAAQLFRRARAEPPGPEVLAGLLLELGRAESLSGEEAGGQSLRAAMAASTDARQRGEIALVLGRMLLWSGDPGAAVEAAQPAADALGWQDADLRLQLEALIFTGARSDMSRIGLIGERLEMVREHADDDTYAGRLIAAQLSWGLTAIAAPCERAVERARRALAGGRLIAEGPNAPDTYLGAIHMLALCDELGEADELFAQAIALAQENGSAPAYSLASCARSYTAYLRGQLDQAELLARDALRISEEAPTLVTVDQLASAYLALALIRRGDVETASQGLAAEPAALEHSPVTWATEMMFAAGCCAVAQGRPEEGAALLLGCGRRAIRWGVINPAWLPWRSEAALALHQLGSSGEPARLCDEELDLARGFGARRPIGIALRARGLIEGGQAGVDLLRQSAEVLTASEARLEQARTLVALGSALRRSNSRAQARDPLTEGLQIAELCGATALAEEARTELVTSGARPRSVFRMGADSLTAAERRVCELAASGKSNPEIAQLLFVTRATVESHLHSAYRRLDIGSRRELAGALGPQEE